MILVITLAGRGRRFETGGYDVPKPFVEVAGRRMVEWAFRSVADVSFSKAVFVTLAEHARSFDVQGLARSLAEGRAEVIELPEVTEGQLSSVLTARDFLRAGEDLLIAGADTFVRSNLATDIENRQRDCRGLISVARLVGDRWSFAAIDETGRVTAVAEKRRISPFAATGLYYFADGREFLDAADEMVADNARTLDEYYVIPVYQRYVNAGKWIAVSNASEVIDMGTPTDARRAEELLRGV